MTSAGSSGVPRKRLDSVEGVPIADYIMVRSVKSWYCVDASFAAAAEP